MERHILEVTVALVFGFVLVAAFRDLLAEGWRILVETWNAPLWVSKRKGGRRRSHRRPHGQRYAEAWQANPASGAHQEELFDEEED